MVHISVIGIKNQTKAATGIRPATDYQPEALLFPDLYARKVVPDFSGGTLSSDGGAMLLRQIDASLGLSRTLAGCFEDRRDQRFVDHSMVQLLAQRIYAVGLGYEDLNDLTELRRDRGIALASPSTLNRLELSNHKASSAHKLPHDPAKVQACLLRMGVRCLPKHAKEIVLDLDSVRHLLQGLREGRHYNDYYGDCCNVPLFIVAGDVVLWAQLRTSDMDGADGVMSALEKIMAAIRRRCKNPGSSCAAKAASAGTPS